MSLWSEMKVSFHKFLGQFLESANLGAVADDFQNYWLNFGGSQAIYRSPVK